MVAEKSINDFVTKLREAAAGNLVSVILYGSAAAGDYVADWSDTNLLCLLRDTSFDELRKLRSALEWWTKDRNRPPLLLGSEELKRSADVFSIELFDMQRSYKVLWGEDVLKNLPVSMKFHRVQVEYELREKTILLRQALMGAVGDTKAMWALLLRSLPGFATLFRHALLELGESALASKRDVVHKLGSKAGIELAAFEQLQEIREHKIEQKNLNVDDVAARYLHEVESVTSAIDRMLDTMS